LASLGGVLLAPRVAAAAAGLLGCCSAAPSSGPLGAGFVSILHLASVFESWLTTTCTESHSWHDRKRENKHPTPVGIRPIESDPQYERQQARDGSAHCASDCHEVWLEGGWPDFSRV